MQKLISTAIILGLSFGGAASVWGSADCGHCLVKQNALSDLQRAEQEYQDLLKKNHEMIARLPADEASKSIKIRSNITMINIKLESVRDNILSANLEISNQCKECRGDSQ